jgi:hypothetical protein
MAVASPAHVRNDFFNRQDLIGSALERTWPPSENAGLEQLRAIALRRHTIQEALT